MFCECVFFHKTRFLRSGISQGWSFSSKIANPISLFFRQFDRGDVFAWTFICLIAFGLLFGNWLWSIYRPTACLKNKPSTRYYELASIFVRQMLQILRGHVKEIVSLFARQIKFFVIQIIHANQSFFDIFRMHELGSLAWSSSRLGTILLSKLITSFRPVVVEKEFTDLFQMVNREPEKRVPVCVNKPKPQ